MSNASGLQYELTTHAKELGFRTVTVIDDDLGTSASGVHRPGFEEVAHRGVPG